MKYWGTLPIMLYIEALKHNYGSEGQQLHGSEDLALIPPRVYNIS
jgi:hypothetical protein